MLYGSALLLVLWLFTTDQLAGSLSVDLGSTALLLFHGE